MKFLLILLIGFFVLFRDEAIELADRALTLPKDERIQEFTDLLEDAMDQKKSNIFRIVFFCSY